jgi:hypothetical protein
MDSVNPTSVEPKNETRVAAGKLPPWEIADLPAPPAWGLVNVFRVIGPGAILLGTTIGGGEWLVGPTIVVKYGLMLLWVTTVAIVLQTLLNLELVRYTLYTGEPILTGLMRTKPGPAFWGWTYSVLAWCQNGWPALAGTAAGTLAAGYLGRLPSPERDSGLVLFFSCLLLLFCGGVLIVGGKVERTLEYINWFMVAWILIYLLIVVALLVPSSRWIEIIRGYVSFGSLPGRRDWFLLGAFAASSGAGGATNAALTNWFRDKGFGMGGAVGYIPSLIGGREVKLSHTGKVFPLTFANHEKWIQWWKFAKVDQYGIFMVGAFLGMSLPALLAIQCLPPGKDLRGLAVAAEIANGLSIVGGPAFWVLTLLCGFWILFSTQLGNIDGLVRIITDMLWTGNKRVRNWRGGDVRRVYYILLGANLLWGMVALQITQPIILFQIGANISGLITMMLSLHTLYVNRTFLPPALRPSLWRQAALVGCALFYGSFVTLWLRQVFS